MDRSDVFRLIGQERARQATIWERHHEWGYGDCSSPAVATPTKLMVLTEEVGEVAQAILKAGPLADGIDDLPELRVELVQVAAVAVAWLESLPLGDELLDVSLPFDHEGNDENVRQREETGSEPGTADL